MNWLQPKEFFTSTNYRELLGRWIEAEKTRRKTFSYRQVASQAGFRSPNYLQQVVGGKKNLGFEGGTRLSSIMKLNALERKYFLSLISFNHARDGNEKEARLMELSRTRKKAANAHSVTIDPTEYDYLSNWIYVTVREFLLLHPNLKSAELISQNLCFGVTLTQAKEALEFLMKSGLIVDRGDHFEVPNRSLASSDEERSVAVQKFHEQVLDLGKQSLKKQSIEEREFGAVTLALSHPQVSRLKKMIKEFRNEISSEFAQADGPGRIYQILMASFPLSKKREEFSMTKAPLKPTKEDLEGDLL